MTDVVGNPEEERHAEFFLNLGRKKLFADTFMERLVNMIFTPDIRPGKIGFNINMCQIKIFTT